MADEVKDNKQCRSALSKCKIANNYYLENLFASQVKRHHYVRMAVTKEIIELFQYLVPGFVSAWIFYGLTAFKRPSQFERVIQALIFTTITQTTLLFIQLFNHKLINSIIENNQLIISMIICILIGLLFSAFANNDTVHKILRKTGVTFQTSYPSEWFGTFSNKESSSWIVLHLKDERRLYGWLVEWPSTPKSGHFVIAYPSWLVEDDSKNTERSRIDRLLIGANRIEWVEFVSKKEHDNDDKKSIKSAAATATAKK